MEHGGKRIGAGRPKGSVSDQTLVALALREYVLGEVIKNKESIVKALISQAKKGNISAIRELFEIAIGKTDRIEDSKLVRHHQHSWWLNESDCPKGS